MISVQSLSKGFHDVSVLQNVTFEVPEGACAGLIGPSGAGKSVLLKILGEVYEQDSGTADVGASVQDVSFMFQEGALFDSISLYDNIVFPLTGGKVPLSRVKRSKREEVHEEVCEILSRVGLLHARDKLPCQLSGGMRRRASLARALVGRPRVLLLDDPTCGLDPVTSSVIMNLIVELHRDLKTTTLIVSHDLRRLIPVCDKILALFDGKIQFDGQLKELEREVVPDVATFVQCRYDLEAVGI